MIAILELSFVILLCHPREYIYVRTSLGICVVRRNLLSVNTADNDFIIVILIFNMKSLVGLVISFILLQAASAYDKSAASSWAQSCAMGCSECPNDSSCECTSFTTHAWFMEAGDMAMKVFAKISGLTSRPESMLDGNLLELPNLLSMLETLSS